MLIESNICNYLKTYKKPINIAKKQSLEMSARRRLEAKDFGRSSYTHTMATRYTSKQTNEWLRNIMKKLGMSSLDELSTMTKINRGSLSSTSIRRGAHR